MKEELEIKKIELKIEQLKGKRMNQMHPYRIKELNLRLEIAKLYRSKKKIKKIEKLKKEVRNSSQD